MTFALLSSIPKGQFGSLFKMTIGVLAILLQLQISRWNIEDFIAVAIIFLTIEPLVLLFKRRKQSFPHTNYFRHPLFEIMYALLRCMLFGLGLFITEVLLIKLNIRSERIFLALHLSPFILFVIYEFYIHWMYSTMFSITLYLLVAAANALPLVVERSFHFEGLMPVEIFGQFLNSLIRALSINMLGHSARLWNLNILNANKHASMIEYIFWMLLASWLSFSETPNLLLPGYALLISRVILELRSVLASTKWKHS